ncbi:MAG: N-acyl-D-amino-acid deacylase family protein [Hyphomicrobiales bacterium]
MTDAIPRSCDTAIRNATIVDGTGAPRWRGDIAIGGDRIVALGDLGAMSATRDIDAAGLVAAPGFIDVHTHDDRAVLTDGAMLPKISQGVTTVVTGNCGISLAPLVPNGHVPPPLDLLGGADDYRFASFGDYLEAFESGPCPVNVAPMIGHSTLRVGTMDDVTRPANDAEIARMQDLLSEAMAGGAVGFSTGLYYPPNRAATIDEVVALLEVAGRSGAIYTTHMRNEGDGVEDSLEESFETARRAGVDLIISHHKCEGRQNFGRSEKTLRRIDEARQRQPVGLDVYPYAASSTVLLPEFVDSALRIIVTWSKSHPEASGRDLSVVAQEWGVSDREAAKRLAPAGAIYFRMDEADVQRILAYPHTMVGSDGLPHDEHPHPRLWGTFPRVLGHYVRELELLSLEDGVRKMTGLTASRFGLADRGTLKAGAFADVVLFAPDTIIDRATFEAPKQAAAGIELVMVNGEVAYTGTAPTGTAPGRMLLKG